MRCENGTVVFIRKKTSFIKSKLRYFGRNNMVSVVNFKIFWQEVKLWEDI